MKTFAFKNASGEISGIGMIYFEDGSYTPEVAEYVAAHGVDAGLIAYANKVKHDPTLTSIIIDTDEMPGGSGMNYDKTFYGAFKHYTGRAVSVDLTKAKAIAHDKRRARREKLMEPLDKLATSPNNAIKNKAMTDKQAVLDADAPVQVAIDAATTPEQLKQILVSYSAV